MSKLLYSAECIIKFSKKWFSDKLHVDIYKIRTFKNHRGFKKRGPETTWYDSATFDTVTGVVYGTFLDHGWADLIRDEYKEQFKDGY